MSTGFDRDFSRLTITEGGYSNHPADRGGETFCGIARNFHPEWPGWAMVDGMKRRGIRTSEFKNSLFLMGQVKNFYRKEFWDKLRCDMLPPLVAAELFDSAVNCGISRAVRWLQRGVNLNAEQDLLIEDGVIGQKTLVKTNVQAKNFGELPIVKVMNGEQYNHYRAIIERDPSQRVFMRGWLKRVWEDHTEDIA